MVVHPSGKHGSVTTIARVKTVRETPAKLVLKIKRPHWQIFVILPFSAIGLLFIVLSVQGGSWAHLECIRRDASRIDCELKSGRLGVTLSKESLQGLRSAASESRSGETQPSPYQGVRAFP